MKPRVNALHDGRGVEGVVIVSSRSFRDWKRVITRVQLVLVSSNLVYIGFGSKANLSFACGNRRFFFAAFLASSCLMSSCFLECGSSELLVFHDLRNYVISRRDGGREDFDTRE